MGTNSSGAASDAATDVQLVLDKKPSSGNSQIGLSAADGSQTVVGFRSYAACPTVPANP